MARYLVVAHQTATSPLLLTRAEELVRGDPRAEFVLLVPEAHVPHALVYDDVETRAVAARRAAEASEAFRSHGLPLLRAETGCSSPTLAIADEIREAPEGYYDAIVLSTLRPGRSRWLRLDTPKRLSARHGVPVLHIAEGREGDWASTAAVRRTLAEGVRSAPPRPVAKPSMLEQSRWFLAAGLGLVALHLVLMTNLAVQSDARFVAVEVLALSVFGVMLLLGWIASRSPGPPEDRRRSTG